MRNQSSNTTTLTFDRTTIAVSVLGALAVALLVALLTVDPHQARAEEVVSSRDYTMITAEQTSGGDALYVLNHRLNKIAVFEYDNGRRTLAVRVVRSMGEMTTTPAGADAGR